MKRRLIEGYWDCKYCGTKKIGRGTRECPNCGKTWDENTTFYMSGQHRYVEPKEAANVNRNPNWICPYCDSLNSDDDKSCRSCGAPRTSENLNYFENKRKKQEEAKQLDGNDEEENSQEERVEKSYSTYSYLNNNRNSLKAKAFNIGVLKYLFIGLLSILAVVGLIYLFIPKDKDITISQMSWERSIDIQRYQTVKESDWSLPTNARLLYSQQEFSHYEEVIDHYETKTRQVAREEFVGYEDYVVGYEDLGNGYFEEIIDSRPVYETYYDTETYEEAVYRDEPVYRTKYYYEIDKWLHERTEKSSGIDKEPYWCEIVLASDERVSSEKEVYYVDGTDEKGKSYHYSMSYDEWLSVEIGQKIRVKVSVLGHATLVVE